MNSLKIKKGDLVKIINGKDAGKTGSVLAVNGVKYQVVIKNLNIAKRHFKPSSKHPKGGIENINIPVNISNVMVICNHCQKPSRIGYKVNDKNKDRICKNCNEIITTSKSEGSQ